MNNYLYSHFSQSLYNNQKNHHQFNLSSYSLSFFLWFSFLLFASSFCLLLLLWLSWFGVFCYWFLLLLWLRWCASLLTGGWSLLGCWFARLLSCCAFLLCLLWLSGWLGVFGVCFSFLFFWFSCGGGGCCGNWFLWSQFSQQFLIFFSLWFCFFSSWFLFLLLDLLSSNSDISN